MVGNGLKSKCSLLSLDNLQATASGPMAGMKRRKQFQLACKSQVDKALQLVNVLSLNITVLCPCTYAGVASVCPETAILCTSTLTLDLNEVFADVPHSEV